MEQNWEIEFVAQPDDRSCVVACMAMVAGVRYAEALESLDGIGTPPISEEAMMMALCRLRVLPPRQLETQLLTGRVYIIDVPSLNFKKIMHSVVLDVRKEPYVLWDPQKGRDGHEWYDYDSLSGWANPVYCIRI